MMCGNLRHLLLVFFLAFADEFEAFGHQRIATACLALPWPPPLQNTGIVYHLGHVFLLAVGHDMNAGYALDLLHFIDDVDAELLAFLLLILSTFDALDDL